MTYVPGMNVLIRDEAWRVLHVALTSTDAYALEVVGLSELVCDKKALFSTEFDSVEILAPVDTELVADTSSQYRQSMLYMESLLRRMPPTDEKLYVGPRAALDVMPFQLEPAARALAQPRQRFLIADAVGLGKTLEAGILLSELIARGRAQRILVVAVKSLLTQFQKEMWSRFTIPLVRLDSTGLQRIRQRIPVNHNPFYTFDKAIISIDTLKQNNEYRRYLENARWDVIVIDEAHNVARRGTGRSRSLRNRLAELLSTRSDALIMLSATPHDGKAQTFASLMNMLDPTAIANEQDYSVGDIKNLYLRRFRKDVKDQFGDNLPERKITRVKATASELEEQVYDAFTALTFAALDQKRSRGAHKLFKTTLEKGLLSSPMACLETINKRVKSLKKHDDTTRYAQDIAQLEAFAGLLEKIGVVEFSKYQQLLHILKHDLNYKPKPKDRLVIFTERIDTMKWLAAQLKRDLNLKADAIRTLHGGMTDTEQQEVVEAFGKEKDKLRVLVASDVASEGINLHYLCHRMIHFDIPWSLMVFQQRNGRIDRYGQTTQPEIFYMLTDAKNAKLNGDTRILEILIEKEEQVQRNIGDPSVLTGASSPEDEERLTADAVEKGDPEAFAYSFENGFDLSALLGDSGESEDEEPDLFDLDLSANIHEDKADVVHTLPSLFDSDFAFLSAALRTLEHPGTEIDDTAHRIGLEVTPELKRRLRTLPQELELRNNRLILTADIARMKESISEARREESSWPSAQFLWRLHPVVEWAQDKMAGAFGRHSAPILHLDEGLDPGEQVVVLSGLISNRKSQPVLHRWFAAAFVDGQMRPLEPFDSFAERVQLRERNWPNRGEEVNGKALRLALLPSSVRAVEATMVALREQHEEKNRPKLSAKLAELKALKENQMQALHVRFPRQPERRNQAQRRIDRIFDEHTQWIEETIKTEPKAFVQVIAVLCAS